jgi:hypothetical protein
MLISAILPYYEERHVLPAVINYEENPIPADLETVLRNVSENIPLYYIQ